MAPGKGGVQLCARGWAGSGSYLGSNTFRMRADARRQRSGSDTLAVALVAAAALLHIALLPEHLKESVLFGAVFATIAALQLAAAWAIWTRPGPGSRAAGRWICLAVVLLFVGARVVAPPGQNQPEALSLAGLLSLILELGAVAALAVIQPMAARVRAGFPWLPAAAIGGTFAAVELLSWGALVYDAEGRLGWFSMSLSRFQPEVAYLTPALAITAFYHWSLYLPLLSVAGTLLVSGLLGYAVGLTILASRLQPDCRARYGLFGAAPATLAAPICCGPSLLSTAGIAITGILASLALPLLALAGILLAADVVWLRRRLNGQLRAA